MKHKFAKRPGFTILELSLASVLIFVLTSVGLYTLNRVKGTEANKQQATDQSTNQEQEKLKLETVEKSEKVSLPAETPTAKPAPPPASKKTESAEQKPAYASINISLAEASINDSRGLFSASWSGSYEGKCYLTIKNLTTGAYISKEAAVSGSSCSLEVPKAELPPGSYKYYMTFKNNEHTVKGSSDYKTFNL